MTKKLSDDYYMFKFQMEWDNFILYSKIRERAYLKIDLQFIYDWY